LLYRYKSRNTDAAVAEKMFSTKSCYKHRLTTPGKRGSVRERGGRERARE
jgi:hypothetical protein